MYVALGDQGLVGYAPVLLYNLDILFPICILVHDILVSLGILELMVLLCLLDILVPDILSSPSVS